MRNVITDRPVALHFSGHGIDDTLGYTNGAEDKGKILLLEDKNSMAYHLYEQDLKDLIKTSQAQLEVVFVASCQSQFAGEAFLNAGAKHVICVRQGQKIGDSSCLLFSKVFYQTLFVKRYNVCSSFEIAKEEVRKVIKDLEADKFILLIQERDGENSSHKFTKSEHQCQAFSNNKSGSLVNLSKAPVIISLPAKPELFAGRQTEMYSINNQMNINKIISVIGISGLGKTALAKQFAHYIKNRERFNDGIIYLECRDIKSAEVFLSKLYSIIKTE